MALDNSTYDNSFQYLPIGSSIKMDRYLKNITHVLLFLITLNSSNGLECTYNGGDLSFCQPGGKITLENPAGINDGKQVVLVNNQSGHTDDACCNRISCDQDNKCKGSNICGGQSCVANNKFKKFKNFNNSNTLFRCLARYCKPLHSDSSCSCTYMYHPMPSEIHILCEDQLVLPVCTIHLSEKGDDGKKALDFSCTWTGEYFGMNAALHLSNLDKNSTNKCSTCGNSIRAGKLLPSVFLKKESTSQALCTLITPSRQPQSCNFSLYITPWKSTIHVGQSINLTCPQSAHEVTWWEVRDSQLIPLDKYISVVTKTCVTFHAATPSEDGFIIMCKEEHQSGAENVLGIGKIIINEASARNLNNRSTTSPDLEEDNDGYCTIPQTESPILTPSVLFITTSQTFLSTSFSLEYSTGNIENVRTSNKGKIEEWADGQLVFIFISLSLALVLSIGMCMFVIIFRIQQKRKTNRQQHETVLKVRYERSHQDTSHDLVVSSKIIQFFDTSEVNKCTKEKHSIAGYQRESVSEEDGTYQLILENLDPQKSKEEDRADQSYYELGEREIPAYSSNIYRSIDQHGDMYYK